MEHTPLKDRPWMPLAMAALGHIIWGFSVLFSKVAMEVAQPDVLLSIRFLLSALLMTLMILFGKAKVSLRGKNLKPLLLLAVTEPMYFYFESYGILYTNATFAGVVLAVAPVVAILLSVLFLKEYPTRRQAVFCLLPVAGVMLMTVSGSSMGIIRPLGVVFLMGACLTSGAYKNGESPDGSGVHRLRADICRDAGLRGGVHPVGPPHHQGRPRRLRAPVVGSEVPDLRGGAEPVLLHPLQQHGQLRGGEDVRGEAVVPGISDHFVFHVCRRSSPA